MVYHIREEGMKMTSKQLIEMGLAYAGMSQAQLAEKLGTTRQAFNNKLARDSGFTLDEWTKIAEAMGATFQIGFKFPDGKIV